MKINYFTNKFVRLLILIILFISISSGLHSQTKLNLDFEYSKPNSNYPTFWFAGGKGYEASLDSAEYSNGSHSLKLQYKMPGDFGVATGQFPIKFAKGKKCKFIGYIKTDNVINGYAGLWFRVDGKNFKQLAFDNMYDRGAAGTTGWQKYEIELPCDTSAVGIYFGGLLTGEGTAWFDNFQVELDGQIFKDEELIFKEPNPNEMKWLIDNSIKLNTVNAGNGFEDLQPLKTMFKDADIIGLGEATHGTSEIFKCKHRLIEFFASEMGYTIFSIEANMPEAYDINEYVLTGKGNVKDLLKGMYFWTWQTKEVADMIEWMKEFNKSGKGKIQFTGFDMQVIDKAVIVVYKYFDECDKEYLKTFKLLIKLFNAYNPWDYKNNGKPNDDSTMTAYSDEIINKIKEKKNIYLKKHSKSEYEWVLQNAFIIKQRNSRTKSRDESMADNIDWIVNNNPKGTKIVLWAHNYHISRDEKNSMGYFLNQKYKDKYMPVGFMVGEGNYTAWGEQSWVHDLTIPYTGTYEYYFRKTGIPVMMLDLRKANNNNDCAFLKEEHLLRSIGAAPMENQFSESELNKLFDVVIYIDKTTHSEMFLIK